MALSSAEGRAEPQLVTPLEVRVKKVEAIAPLQVRVKELEAIVGRAQESAPHTAAPKSAPETAAPKSAPETAAPKSASMTPPAEFALALHDAAMPLETSCWRA